MWNRIRKGEFVNAPGYVATFLILLGVCQLGAILWQFRSGFFPFLHEPARVPFSWDMFATRTERCLLEWSPSLKSTPVGGLKNLAQLSQRFEWDLIYDSFATYIQVGHLGCSFEAESAFEAKQQKAVVKKIQFTLHCFLPEGDEIYREFSCS